MLWSRAGFCKAATNRRHIVKPAPVINSEQCKSSQVLNWLRRMTSIMFCSASLALIVLWMRNAWRADVAWAPLPHQGHVVIASLQGQMEIALKVPTKTRLNPPRGARGATPNRWGAQSYIASPSELRSIVLPRTKPFRSRSSAFEREINIMAPYWFLVPATWLLAAAPWVQWSTRFSLRALLIASTLIALALSIYTTSGW
jgi:hypothetical protein